MDIDRQAVEALTDRVIGPEHKALPPAAWGSTVREFLATAPVPADFQTPLLTLDRAALAANTAIMGDWAAAHGVRLAPHGKTTMAPRLWADQLAAGSWGLTFATLWQVQLARAYRVRRIVLANEALDPVGVAWLAAEAEHDPEFECWCWVDSVVAVDLLRRRWPAGAPPLRVLVEVGGPGGRTGTRDLATARAVADAVHGADTLRLAGVGGYEGILGADRGPAALAAVRAMLDAIAGLHEYLRDGVYDDAALVTAGGSAYPDLVVERLAELSDEAGARGTPTTVVLRAGAYLVHDDGFYAGISPLTPDRARRPLRSAMHGWARVVSRPEPGLALLDAGKRDLPYDKGFPVPQRALIDGAWTALPDASVTGMDDQHAYLRLPAETALPVGSTVRLGLSHPCTAFDKWRLIPVLDDVEAPAPRVIDLVHTFF
ncbi:alanine racemase [Nocardia takedensis]|uniref:alanine racemase n=1 Tax=Nocardia takedensis TaxID=259390 RepID=UPI00030C1786|nr:alanine racemase [Nocardia takedensis]